MFRQGPPPSEILLDRLAGDEGKKSTRELLGLVLACSPSVCKRDIICLVYNVF